MDLIHIRPAKGLRVLDPETRQPLPEEGAEVPLSTFWRRRLRAGDVERVKTEAAKPPAKKKAKG